MKAEFGIGSLVRARDRDWIVLAPEQPNVLRLRALTGREDEIAGLYLPLEADERLNTTYRETAWSPTGDAERHATLLIALQTFLQHFGVPYLFFDAIESSGPSCARRRLRSPILISSIDGTSSDSRPKRASRPPCSRQRRPSGRGGIPLKTAISTGLTPLPGSSGQARCSLPGARSLRAFGSGSGNAYGR